MPLQVVTPTRADASELAGLLWESYADSAVTRRMMKKIPSPDIHSEMRAWTAGIYERGWDSAQRRVVKDTDSGEIAALLSYTFVPTVSRESLKTPPDHSAFEAGPPSLDLSVLQELELGDHGLRAEVMGTQQFLYVAGLATRPSFQRCGAGRMLMDHVVAEADRRNLPAFLIATAAGKPLYQRLGFVVRAEKRFDMSSVNEPDHTHWAMYREAPRPGDEADFPELPRRPVRVLPMEGTFEECVHYDEVATRAFGPDPLIELCFNSARKAGPEKEGAEKERAEKERTAANARKEMAMVGQKCFLHHKAVDADNPDAPPLGYAKWYIAEDPDEDVKAFGAMPPDANLACFEASLGAMHRFRDSYFRERKQPYFFMAHLATSPEAQRRGVGSSLLREGLRLADERGWPAFIDASPAGVGLYKKFGWEQVFEVTINLKDFGGEDQETTTVSLVRQPGAPEKKKQPAPTDRQPPEAGADTVGGT